MSLDDMKYSEQETKSELFSDPLSAFEEIPHVDTAVSKKKVSKRTRTLIFTSALAILLAAILLVLTLLPDPDAIGSSSSSTPIVDTSITLLDKTVKDTVVIQQVDIHNKDDQFTLVYNGTEKRMVIKDYEDISLDKELVNTLIAYTTLISAVDKVDVPGDLKGYGLDEATCTATITYTDGSTVTLTIGNQIPSEDGYYAQISGDDNVYIFETDCVYLFTVRAAAFAGTVLMSTPTVKSSDANGTAVLKSVKYSGKNHPAALTLRRSYHTDSEEMTLFSYIIAKPYMRGTTDAVSGLLSSFKSLQASQALYLHPTAEQKKKLGFNDPLVVMEITMAVETSEDSDESSDTSDSSVEEKIYYNSYTTTLTVGSTDNNNNYIVMIDGIDAIFLVDYSALYAVAERTYTNSVNQLLFLKNIGELGRLSVTIDGTRHDFQMTHYPDKENRDEMLIITNGNKTYPTADFRELYQLLMGLERYGAPTNNYEKDVIMEVDLYTNEGEHYLGATYYSLSGTLCAVETTEGEVFTTRWRNVTHFVEQVKNYLNGDDVLMLT